MSDEPTAEESMAEEHEGEDSHGSVARTWGFVALLCLAYIAWVAAIYYLVGERERGWQHGVRPSVPAEAWISSYPPAPVAAQQKMLASPVDPKPTADTTPPEVLTAPLPYRGGNR